MATASVLTREILPNLMPQGLLSFAVIIVFYFKEIILESPSKDINTNQEKKKYKKTKSKSSLSWPIKIFFITFALSLFFSISSEMLLSNSNLIVAIFIIITLFFLGTLFDMIGVACAACPIEDFTAMASRKEKGARESITLIKHADKVSSFCCDIVGDICGILSGSAGAVIVFKLSITGDSLQIIVSALISSLIAAIMVGLKAIGKVFAVNKSSKVVLMCGKFLSNFSGKKNK